MANRTIHCPLKFDGLYFPIWKIKMIIFLQSQDSCVAKTITKLFVCPEGDEDRWSDIATKEYDANFKAHYALLQALNDDNISRAVSYTHLTLPTIYSV